MSAARNAALGLLVLAGLAAACSPFRPTSTCQIASGPRGAPVLYRQSADNRFRSGAVSVEPARQKDGPICEGSSAADQCELSDDIEALTGGALVVGPDGKAEAQPVCPAIEQTITCEKVSDAGPSCAGSACPNLQLKIEGKDGMVAHVLMYDDPSCQPSSHRNPCAAKPEPCYYRVHSVALDLSGKALEAP